MSIFGKTVEFVPPGVTAEEARIQRAKQLADRWKRTQQNPLVGIGAIIALVAMVAVPAWLIWGNGHKASATIDETGETAPDYATAIAYPPETATVTATATPTETASPTPTMTPTETPTQKPEKLGKPLAVIEFNSPIAAPRHNPPEETPTPTNTPAPTYQVLYTATWPENNPGASYHVSGWVVEADGKTPRPVAMEICYHKEGCMQYPRPGQNDVSTGYYEFLVQPGYWELKVKDADGLTLPFTVYPDGPARYEISIKFNGDRRVAAARSNPWNTAYPTPTPEDWLPPDPTYTPTPEGTPTATPERPYHIYLPVVVR